jgi:hypothetical protein
MYSDFSKGNYEVLRQKTHTSLIEYSGGRESYDLLFNKTIQQITLFKVKMISFKFENPEQLYTAGNEIVCFVPRASIMKVGKEKIKTVGYMVAIRKINSKEWFYLDGAGFQDDKNLLWELLPLLPKTIELPPNHMEGIM